MKKLLLVGIFYGFMCGASDIELPLLASQKPSPVDRNEHKGASAKDSNLSLFKGLQINAPAPQKGLMSYEDMNQFKQAVAISNTVKDIIDDLGRKYLIKTVTYKPFEKYAPQFTHYTQSGFEWTIDKQGTHSLISPWGSSVIAQNFVYAPRTDGFDPSGSFDQQLIPLLGIQVSHLQKGAHFSDDPEPVFLYPNIDENDKHIVNEDGHPVRYIMACHNSVDKPAQFIVGEPVEEKEKEEISKEWARLKKELKEQKLKDLQPALKRLKEGRSRWRKKCPKQLQRFIEQPRALEASAHSPKISHKGYQRLKN